MPTNIEDLFAVHQEYRLLRESLNCASSRSIVKIIPIKYYDTVLLAVQHAFY